MNVSADSGTAELDARGETTTCGRERRPAWSAIRVNVVWCGFPSCKDEARQCLVSRWSEKIASLFKDEPLQ